MRHRHRLNLALLLLAASIGFNLVILLSGDTSVGWPLAAVIALAAAGFTLLGERREP